MEIAPRGRPRVPADLQKLIVEMATNNPTWGEERIAHELLLKIGIRISPRTIRRYIPKPPRATRRPGPTLADSRAEPHQSHHRRRLLYRCDGNVPVGLRVRDHGTRYETHPALYRYSTSDCRVDASTVSRVREWRRRLPIRYP